MVPNRLLVVARYSRSDKPWRSFPGFTGGKNLRVRNTLPQFIQDTARAAKAVGSVSRCRSISRRQHVGTGSYAAPTGRNIAAAAAKAAHATQTPQLQPGEQNRWRAVPHHRTPDHSFHIPPPLFIARKPSSLHHPSSYSSSILPCCCVCRCSSPVNFTSVPTSQDGHVGVSWPQHSLARAGASAAMGRRRVPRVLAHGVRAGVQGPLRRGDLRLRRRGVGGGGRGGVGDRAGHGERRRARRRHRRHLRRRLLHRGRRVVAGPLAHHRLRPLERPLHGGHPVEPPERETGPREGGPGSAERRAESDKRHQQLAVSGAQRPVRDRRRRERPAGARAPTAAGDQDRRGHGRRRGWGGALLLGVPAGHAGGRVREAAARLRPRLPRAVHRPMARQARLLPALPARHLKSEPRPAAVVRLLCN